MIGICTRYNFHESTFAAIRIADWARVNSRPVSMYTMTKQPGNVDSYWDTKVICQNNQLFTEWAIKCTDIVWTAVPHLEQLHWVRQHLINSVMFVLSHELNFPSQMPLLRLTRHLLCPTNATFNYLHGYGLRNMWRLPWDPGLPIYRKSADHKITPKVLLPLWDGNARRTEMTVVDIVSRALSKYPKAEFTIAYSSSTMRATAQRQWKKLRKRWPSRVHLRTGLSVLQRLQLFREHDLTLWPTHFENLNHVGLCSIMMGTPVLGFEFSPTSEILGPGNSILVPTQQMQYRCGLTAAVPDYALMDYLLQQTLGQLSVLAKLHRTINFDDQIRKRQFDEQLQRVFK